MSVCGVTIILYKPRDGPVRGNKRSKVYHLAGCPGFATMSAANIITFASEAEAQQAGYRKAGNCP